MLAYVGVGSNLGDRWANLALAARTLRAETRVALLRASRVWDSAPLGPPQPRYLNAVLELETRIAAPGLLAILQLVERGAGRTRGGVRWSARTLDLDLLLFGDQVIRRPKLVLCRRTPKTTAQTTNAMRMIGTLPTDPQPREEYHFGKSPDAWSCRMT